MKLRARLLDFRDRLVGRVLKAELTTLRRDAARTSLEKLVEFYLDCLTPPRIAKLDIAACKQQQMQCRLPNIDVLIQALAKARWTIEEREEAIRDDSRRNEVHQMSLDAYLTTVHGAAIRPEEAVRRLQEEATPFVEHMQLLVSLSDDKLDYYQRHYSWLLEESRSLLEAMLQIALPALQN